MATVLFALVIAVLVGEIGVRMLSPQNLSGTWRRTDQHGVFVHEKNHSARHQLGNRVVKYRFNDDGLRDLGQGDADIRVLCLGDSFTFGWLLSDEDTFISRLQKKADLEFGDGRFVLLNGGHGGWGTSDYVRFFEEIGSDFQLTGLIVFLNTDDIGRSLRKPKYDLLNGGSIQPTAANEMRKDGILKRITNSTSIYPWLLEHCHLLQLARNAAVAVKRGPKEDEKNVAQNGPQLAVPLPKSAKIKEPSEASELGRALFKRLKKLADDRSIELVVLTTGFHPVSSADDSEPTRAFMSTAEQMFEEEGITFYDCSDKFRANLQDDLSSIQIIGDGHPNEEGARNIAAANWPAVQEFLIRLGSKNEPAGSSGDLGVK
jgi:hypothetical protein